MVVDFVRQAGMTTKFKIPRKKVVRINSETATMLQEVAAGANEEFGVE